MSKVEVRWRVSDGFVNHGVEHSFSVYAEDFLGASEDDIMQQIYDNIEDDFRETASWAWTNKTEFMERLKEELKEAGGF